MNGAPAKDPAGLGALATLLAAGLALGIAGLLPPEICLLTLILTVAVGVLVPSWIPLLSRGDSPQRTGAAVLMLLLLVVATFGSGPGALTTGRPEGLLTVAAEELGLPTSVPIGLFAALAAGALVVVTLELTDRRGVQSALVLGIAVLGLASVASPGWHLLPVVALGWPAALFTLAQLANSDTQGGRHASPVPNLMMRPGPGASGPAPAHRGVLRWRLLPVLAAITVGGLTLTVVIGTGVAAKGARASSWRERVGAASPTKGQARSGSDYLGTGLDLNARGALPTDPVLKLPTDSPELWRAGTLDVYTGRQWVATPPAAGLPRLIAGSVGEVMVVPAPGAETAGSGAVQTDRVRPLSTVQLPILAPGRLISLSAAGLVPDALRSITGDQLIASGFRGPLGDYSVSSEVPVGVDDPQVRDRLIAVGRGVDEPATARWTDLPANLPDRVRQLGLRLVGGSSSRLGAVLAIESELHRRMTYNLNSPVPPAGKDAVDDALFVSHTGFCEQFASAEVVLLRAAGIPARLAVGFAGGDPGDDGFRTVLGSDAHAWVEIWFPGLGWVTSDPTAGATLARTGWQPIRDVIRRYAGRPGSWIAGGLIVVLLTVGLLRRRWSWRRRRSRARSETGSRTDPHLAAAFAQLETVLAGQGRARAPNETLAALGRRLPPETLPPALAVLERALYAPRPPSRAECLAAAATIVGSLEQLLELDQELEPAAAGAPGRSSRGPSRGPKPGELVADSSPFRVQ